jgi:acetolactate synthase I/II/III large subunit
VVILLFRDDAYGVIRWKQLTRYGRESGVAFGNPDFVALARAFGARGERVQSADELIPALEAAFAGRGPCLIDVPIEYRENLKLTERLGQLVCPI